MKKGPIDIKNIKIKRDKSTSFLIKKRFQRTHASLSSSSPHDTTTRLLLLHVFFFFFDFVIRENDPSSRFFHQERWSEGIKTARLGIFVVRPPSLLTLTAANRHARQDAILFLLCVHQTIILSPISTF